MASLSDLEKHALAPVFHKIIKNEQNMFDTIDEYDYYVLSITHGVSIETKEIYRDMNISTYPYIKRFDIYGKHGYTTKVPQSPVSLTDDELKKTINKKSFLGKVITDMSTFYPTNGNVLAPAILFTIVETDLKTDFYREAIGIWLYDKNNKDENKKYTKILDIDEYYKLKNTYNALYLTYSIILTEIDKILKTKIPNIKNKKIAVGFFSCRDVFVNYIPEYNVPFIITDKIEKYMYPPLKNTKILNEPNDYFFKPLYIKTKYEVIQEPYWKGALATLQHQGCGLNVLSFYDFLITYHARAKTVCLTLNGTSIFKIIEYLDFYLTNRKIETKYTRSQEINFRQIIASSSKAQESQKSQVLGKRKRTSKNSNKRKKSYTVKNNLSPKKISDFKIILNEWMSKANPKQYPNYPNNNKYIVSRHHINDLIKLFKTLFLYSNINGCVIIIKIYKTNNHKQQDNHRGHTISFLFLNENVFLVDPQQQDTQILKNNPPIYIKNENKVNLTDNYKNYNYFDMIWFSNTKFTETDILYEFKKTIKQINDFDTVIEIYDKDKYKNKMNIDGELLNTLNEPECKIIQYRDDINYGGNF
jgi:hypothetical protein